MARAGEPGLVLRDDRFAIPQDEAFSAFGDVALMLRVRRAAANVSKHGGGLTLTQDDRLWRRAPAFSSPERGRRSRQAASSFTEQVGDRPFW